MFVTPTVVTPSADGAPANGGNIWVGGYADPDLGEVSVRFRSADEGGIDLLRTATADTNTAMWEAQAYGAKDPDRLPLGTYTIEVSQEEDIVQSYNVTLARPFAFK